MQMGNNAHPPSAFTRPLVGDLTFDPARSLFEKAALFYAKDLDMNKQCIGKTRKALATWIAQEKANGTHRLFRVSDNDENGSQKPSATADDEDGPQPFPMWKVMLDLSSNWRQLTRNRRVIHLTLLGGEPNFPPEMLRSTSSKTSERQLALKTLLSDFCEAFFDGLRVEWMDDGTKSLPSTEEIVSRIHPVTGEPQRLTTDILGRYESHVPENSVGVVTIRNVYSSCRNLV